MPRIMPVHASRKARIHCESRNKTSVGGKPTTNHKNKIYVSVNPKQKGTFVMRKFVSAVTSLAIAATALSSTMVFNASAADKTIFEFRSNGSNTVEVSAEDIAAGSVSVPVVLYVPASTGFNTASLKMAINGGETIGQYAGQTINGVEHTQYHFGNYGIQIETYVTGEDEGGDYEGFSFPCCLDGGELTGAMGAGYAVYCPTCIFVPSSFNMIYQHSNAVQSNKNVDSYGAYATNGTTGVTTWDETDSWAYEYGLAEFNLILPQNLAEGEYVLDIYKDEYVNIASLNLETPVKGKSAVTGVGKVEWESRALTIKVGDAATTTTSSTTSSTTTSSTTTSSTTSSTTTSSTTSTDTPIVVDGQLIQVESATVAPGEEVTLKVTVSGDTGTAGSSLYFLYDEALTLNTIAAGTAYRTDPQVNATVPTTDGKNNVAAFVWASNRTLTAKDGATLFTMTFTAPTEPGEYNIDLLGDLDLIYDGVHEKFNQVNNLEGEEQPFTVIGGTITVTGDVDTTTTTTTTVIDTTTTTSSTTTSSTTSSTTTSSTTTSSTTSLTAPDDGEIFWGDVDCDGDVDIADVVRLNKFNAGNADVSAQGQLNADCAYDGALDAEDALAIKKYLAHILKYEDLGNQ